MKTGEGKTLMATLAAYLNALPGKGVHVVTVNDYLASRALTVANASGIRLSGFSPLLKRSLNSLVFACSSVSDNCAYSSANLLTDVTISLLRK
jgi:hypothetical protein